MSDSSRPHGQQPTRLLRPWDFPGKSTANDVEYLIPFSTFVKWLELKEEKKMATHSSVLAWGLPGTGEPDGLLSVGSHRVGHD